MICKKLLSALFPLLITSLLGAAPGTVQERFQDQVGAVTVAPVAESATLQLPFITWGGDTATFHANGGLKTRPGTIFQKLGLGFELTPGDDFIGQVRNYMSGKTPYLRGTFRMMGLASEVIGSDPRTKGVVVMQMTWSAGDHMVGREAIKQLGDLKGKRIAIQNGGPHVGMLDDVLRSANLGWDDIQVVWASDLTGEKGPAALFRKDPEIDACFVISPDMIGLTGGLDATGTGAEGTVRGSRVVISTAQLSRSIADVYVCRKDYYDSHREQVTKFVAGYLKACEEVVKMKNAWEKGGSKEYEALLQMTQDIYGADVIPTLEEDAHGLIADCSFVGYPGNVKFFTAENNPVGFESFQKNALDLAASRGYAKVRSGLFPSGLDYRSDTFLKYLSVTDTTVREKFDAEAALDEIEALGRGDVLDDRTLLSFTISFEPNQTEFSEEVYGPEFQRVVELGSKFGNAIIAIRGHADPSKALIDFIKAGQAKGILKREGSRGNYRYFLNGKALDLEDTGAIMTLIERGEFDGVEPNPRDTVQAALNLSRVRAEKVRDSVVEYAKRHGLELDKSQIQPIGVGIREPLIAKPGNMAEAQTNMRVEFRLVKVPAEVLTDSEFDF